MKRLILSLLALALIFCACAAPAQTVAEPSDQPQVAAQEPAAEAGSETEPEPAPTFDLEAYKSAVDQFRRDVMDNTLYVGNIVSHEANYMKIMINISGRADSESTLETVQEWFEENADVTLDDVDAAHKKIKEEYASLIITEIEGKEAEELDAYVRTMYEGYSDLYQYSKTALPANYSSFAKASDESLSKILSANRDISLFCGDYE